MFGKEKRKLPAQATAKAETEATAFLDEAIRVALTGLFEDLRQGRPLARYLVHAESQAEVLLRLQEQVDRRSARRAIRAYLKALIEQTGPDD